MIRSWPLFQTLTLIALSLASLVMVGIVYAELTWPMLEPGASAPAATANRPRSEVAAKFSLAPLQSFSAVTERPLFAQSRRAAQGSDNTLGPWSNLVLTGVIISATSREALILHGKQPQTVVHVAEGQEVDGWVITSIRPDRVVITGDGADHELRLLEKSAAPTTPVPGVVAPPRRNFNP